MVIHDFMVHYQILSLLESLRESLGIPNFMAHTWRSDGVGDGGLLTSE